MGIRNRRMKYLRLLSLFGGRLLCECVHGKELDDGGKKLRSFSNGRTARP